jgi:hypothetical protein
MDRVSVGDQMKIPLSKLKFITIISMLVILGIGGSYLIFGFLFQSVEWPAGNLTRGGDQSLTGEKLNDIQCVVQEWNLSFVHNRTIVHVTYDELKEFPDFESAMQGVNNDPGAWSYGTRVVKWFDGNDSEYIRFHHTVCKNKTMAECFPNPPIFEYHGQYYSISFDRYRLPPPL